MENRKDFNLQLSRNIILEVPIEWVSQAWNSPGQNTGVGSCSLLQGIFPTQGSNPGLPTLQVDSLPAEPQGKPKNTGVGAAAAAKSLQLCLTLCDPIVQQPTRLRVPGISLSHFQLIFTTQELNRGFLHCRQILYQLSHQVSSVRGEFVEFEVAAYDNIELIFLFPGKRLSLEVTRATVV